jgi:arylsulfatase A-like enzyme
MRARGWTLVLPLLLSACARPADKPAASAVRLVDAYKPEAVEGRSTPASERPRSEWRFDGPPGAGPHAATRGFAAGPGVASLAVRDGRLVGRSTTPFPLLHLERTSGLDDRDILHAVEVRARLSAGGRLGVSFRGGEKVDLAEVIKRSEDSPWRMTSPVVAGSEMRTYTLETRLLPQTIAASRTRHVLVRPTDAAGSTFEVESVRLIFRREHLAGVASGLGWHGLSEIYRETLVGRSPEVVRFSVRLPERPWLDLGVGTVEDEPVTFRVGVSDGQGQEKRLAERTVTTAHRWEELPVDLTPYAGRTVTLSLALAAEKAAVLGFWGAPTLRSRAVPTRTAAAGAPAPPQSVIVVFADTLRRDHLGAYGYARNTSPHLDRLAREGTLFRDCVGQATWTKVATPTLMTSLYPSTHGVEDFSHRLPASAATLAEVYRDAGYATVSLSSILFTGKFTNLHRGFELVHEDSSLPDPDSSKTARIYVDRLLPWIEAHRDGPFFAFLHVADPHDPYRPYPPYDTMWANPARHEEHEKQNKEVRKFIDTPLLKAFGMPTREQLVKAGFDAEAYVAHDRDLYDGSIRAMDAEIGRLVERLRALRLEGKVLVVFTGDHGEEFLEHGRTFHGQSVYSELAAVPLIFWGPGLVPAGRVVDRVVQTVDIMPTLLAMSRLPLPAQAQGHSFLPLIHPGGAPGGNTVRADGPAWVDRPAIIEKAVTTEPMGAPPPQDTASTAILFEGWKLVHNTKRHADRPEFELYDHARDPLDQNDVAAAHPDVVKSLSRQMQAWRKMATAARLKPDAEAAKGLSKAELERLRSLGYIQ